MATRKAGQGSKWIRKSTRLAIYMRDGMACIYCQSAVEDGERLTLDHVRPCAKGGQNGTENLVTCCHRCNSSRKDRSLRSWAEVVSTYTGAESAADVLARVRRHVRRTLPRAAALEALRA